MKLITFYISIKSFHWGFTNKNSSLGEDRPHLRIRYLQRRSYLVKSVGLGKHSGYALASHRIRCKGSWLYRESVVKH